MKNCLIKLMLAAAVVAALPACAPVVVAGAMVGGGLVAVDRRTSGIQIEDQTIELRANSRVREALADRGHFNITSYNRQVLVTGEVPSDQDKKMVEQIISRVDNVRNVINELQVIGNSSLIQRSSDALITGQAKALLVDAKDLYAGAFKVVTERGVVYLMGRVTQRESDRATEVLQGVSGVQKLVRIFEIIPEEELQRLLPQPAPAEHARNVTPQSPN